MSCIKTKSISLWKLNKVNSRRRVGLFFIIFFFLFVTYFNESRNVLEHVKYDDTATMVSNFRL